MAQVNRRLRQGALIFDEVRAAEPEHRAFIDELTDRYVAEGLVGSDLRAFQREQTRGLLQDIRKQRLATEEARQAALNLTRTLEDGTRIEFYKAIEDMTPEECAGFMHQQAKVIRREREKFARLHAEFKDLHGRKYLRQLRLNLEEYLPPQPQGA